MSTITCPDCKGQRENLCFVDRFKSETDDELTGCVTTMKCDRCEGVGEVDARMPTWIEQGKAIRHQRVHSGKYVDMHTMAKELGIPLVEYSAIERGKVDNTWLFQWLNCPEVTP